MRTCAHAHMRRAISSGSLQQRPTRRQKIEQRYQYQNSHSLLELFSSIVIQGNKKSIWKPVFYCISEEIRRFLFLESNFCSLRSAGFSTIIIIDEPRLIPEGGPYTETLSARSFPLSLNNGIKKKWSDSNATTVRESKMAAIHPQILSI
jgi:hypothetical protein